MNAPLLEVEDITLRFGGVTLPARGLRPRTPSSPGSLALARSTGRTAAEVLA